MIRIPQRQMWMAHVLSVATLVVITWLFAFNDHPLRALWPSLVALAVVFGTRQVLIGLLAGAIAGALILTEGNPFSAMDQLMRNQLLPIFGSEWKLGALAFTLLLGGFVALMEASRGLHALMKAVLGNGRDSPRRVQLGVTGFGLLVFFDGLANTMLVGRLMRNAVDRVGVSRAKLAYLADATGSAVACLAFVSTWIAFQLAMIREGYAEVGLEAGAYRLFFLSLPANFYCWFTLVMVLVCALRDFNLGPMRHAEMQARKESKIDSATEDPSDRNTHWLCAVIPVTVLVFAVPVIAYLMGADSIWPITPASFVEAYGTAENYVPRILVLAALVASMVAAVFLWTHRRKHASQDEPSVAKVYLGGMRDLLGPIGILLAAWLLGGATSELGAGKAISELLGKQVSVTWIPLLVFLTGAAISFSTGTSWGTMAILMPLVIPVIHDIGDGVMDESLVAACIGATFSGAVFGDHCSPFSDTTLVASMAAGIQPMDHVRTQLPFALITAVVAALVGFLPLGLGMPAWLSLIAGTILLFVLPLFQRR